MSVPNLRHPYHLPACYDGDTDKGPGNLTLKYVKEIYDDVIFSGFSNSNDEVTTDPRYYRINELHHDAFRKTSMTDIFDEYSEKREPDSGNTVGGYHGRDLFHLHRDWRWTLAFTTIQNLQILRPIFDMNLKAFVPESESDPWTAIYVHNVWEFFSLLLDFVLEGIANQLISGDFSTETAHQLAEQLLIRFGSGVKPLMDFYGDICQSDIFNHIIGRRAGTQRTQCSFKSAYEIANDLGGMFVFDTVTAYITAAHKAIFNFMDLECETVIQRFELCGIQFPQEWQRNLMSWSELRDIAFHPIINGLFVPDTLNISTALLKSHESSSIITFSRLRLFCALATRNLTHGLFNFLTHDVVAHNYWKRHHHVDLPVECFAFASTRLMFQVHAIRTGIRAGQMHPVVDPNFRMRDDDGNMSTFFRGIWRANKESIADLCTLTAKDASDIGQEVFGFRSPDTPAPPQPGRTKSFLNMTRMMTRAQAPSSAAAASPDLRPPSASGSSPSVGTVSPFNRVPGNAGPLAITAPSSPVTPGSPAHLSATSAGGTMSPTLASRSPGGSQFPVIAALQDFTASCKLQEKYWFALEGDEQHFPLLKGPASSKATRLALSTIQESAGVGVLGLGQLFK